MLSNIILAIATASTGVLATNSGCAEDNCARAIIASAFTQIAGSADCQSYFGTVTVTASDVIYTQTSTTVLDTTFSETSTFDATDIESQTSTSDTSLTTTETSTTLTTTTTSEYASVTATETSTEYTTVTSTVTSTITPAQYYKRALATIAHLPPQAKRNDIFSTSSSDCVTKLYTSTYVYTSLIPGSTSIFAANSTTSSTIPSSLAQTCPGAPTYASACNGCEQYTSACSCVGVTGQTTVTIPGSTLTTIVPETSIFLTTESFQVTLTATSTQTLQATSTATITSTVTETTTVTETYSSTQSFTESTSTTATSTATSSTSALASPTCVTLVEGSAQIQYSLEYAGFQTLNPNNPGNDQAQAPPITATYSGSLDTCAAAAQCGTFAANTYTPVGGAYFVFNLQYDDTTSSWICVAYFDRADASYFNVDTPGISQSYGWTQG